jgi:hypothetical protein
VVDGGVGAVCSPHLRLATRPRTETRYGKAGGDPQAAEAMLAFLSSPAPKIAPGPALCARHAVLRRRSAAILRQWASISL